MKKILFVVIVATLSSCCHKTSWQIFSEKYEGKFESIEEKENYFLDCYVGSQEWEEDLK